MEVRILLPKIVNGVLLASFLSSNYPSFAMILPALVSLAESSAPQLRSEWFLLWDLESRREVDVEYRGAEGMHFEGQSFFWSVYDFIYTCPLVVGVCS